MVSADAGVAALVGLALGARHAADADHLIAVAAIVSRSRRVRAAWWVGALWGAGHSLTVLAVGGAVILLKVAVPPRLAQGSELAVGGALVVLGLMNLMGLGAGRGRVQVHAHEHGHGHHGADGDEAPAHAHAHVHAEGPAWLDQLERSLGLAQAFKSFALGLLHGLAGSAAVALMALAAVPGPALGILYLLMFGAGTLLGMSAVTLLMGASFAWFGDRLRWERWAAPAAGLLSLLFGAYMVLR